MAKALLKTGTMVCDDLTDEESEQADNTREIINTQNHQIQVMRGLLSAKSYPEQNDCEVVMSGSGITTEVVWDIQEEPPVSSADTAEVSFPATSSDTSQDTLDNVDVEIVTTTTTPDGSSSASKGNALTKNAIGLLLLSLCLSNFGF